MRYRPLLFISLLFLASCLKDKDYDLSDVTLTPTMAVPLAFGDISILDLISENDSAFIKVYPDGLLYFYYTQTLASKDITGLFEIPNNSSTASFDLPAGTLPPSSQDILYSSITKTIDLGLSPEQLSEMLLKSGTMGYVISVTPPNPNLLFEVKLTLADVTDQSLVPMTVTSSSGSGTRQLVNHVVKMDKNKFNASLDLILKKRTNPVFIAPGSKVNVQLNFNGLNFNYIKGFFGDQTTNLPAQTIDLGVFSSSLNKSNVTFVQPVVKMKVVNDYGMTCEVNFSKLEAKKTGAILPLQINPTSPVNLSYPVVFGNSATTNVTVTNADAILNFSPTQLYYAASARINKGLVTATNFLSDTSKLRVTLSTEVPLYGRASGIKMIDTLAVDLGEVDGSNVTKASLRIRATNELPLDANIQIYMADASYHVLDSLFAPNQTYIVKSSTVTAGGELQTAGTSELTLGLDAAKISKLFSSRHLIIKTTFNTAKDAGGNLLNVKFKAAYKLKLNVGLNATINVKVE